MAIKIFKSTKDLMKELEQAFKGISAVHDGMESLENGMKELKLQRKGLGKDVYKGLNQNFNALNSAWKKKLKELNQRFSG